MKKATRILTLVLAVMMMALTVSASFTPSVEQKPAPQVKVDTVDEKGDPAILIYDEKDEVTHTTEVPNLVVVPYAERETAAPSMEEALNSAYEQIDKAENLGVLVPELNDAAKEAGVAVEDLVVRDLFDMALDQESLDVLKESGNYVVIKFELALAEGEQLFVLQNLEGENWQMIPADLVVVNDDGTVSVTFYDLAPVAFAVNRAPEAEETLAAEVEVEEAEETEAAAEEAEEAEAEELSLWQKFLNLFK